VTSVRADDAVRPLRFCLAVRTLDFCAPELETCVPGTFRKLAC
jgi:hypothetical protein